MKLAFSTNAYTRFPLLEALHDIKHAGFAGVEILADVPHAYPPLITAQLTASVVKALETTGLSVSNVNCNCSFGYWKHAPPEPYFEPSLISPIARYRADRSAMIMTTLDFAKRIGARNISITSGRTLGGMPPDKAAVQFAESMRPILDHADKLGIDVGVECEPGLFLEYIAELRDWIDRLGHSRFGANLDIGHSVVIGESISEVVAMVNGRIWNMHVEDLPGRKHYHMIPGEGTLDWDSLKLALEKIQYDRFLTVELYTHTENPREAAEKSFAFLSKKFG
ncbi:MAG TPA: sugar phosphate isomerase/epimerase family protein [Tepidisphaeraceae bacterium]|jgi:sugar phosphate isomerase/epimerase|nr:sugar phosphate isomerase/epimerase family protein [Tepidisphaeraceae bacterium]